MKPFLVLLALGVMAVQPTFASDDHNHENAVEAAPHGGVLRDAPPYKVELVLKGDNATLYVYDTKLVPVKLEKPSMNGTLRFPKDKKQKTIVFKKAGDVYESVLPGINKVHRYELHVDIEAQGKKIMADFGVDNIH